MCCDKAQKWGPQSNRDRAALSAINQVVKVQVQDHVAQDQSTDGHAVARMYKVFKSGESLSAEELQPSGTELKKLHARREDLRIRTDGVLKIRLGNTWVGSCWYE